MDAPDAGGGRAARLDWGAVDALRSAVSVPVIVKGVMTAGDASAAVSRGAQGLVVSNYGRTTTPGQPAPLDAVAPIVEAVGPQVPVLVDGGIRRGSDVMKALASGARAVLVARPVMWGLAAYGADGVLRQLAQIRPATTLIGIFINGCRESTDCLYQRRAAAHFKSERPQTRGEVR